MACRICIMCCYFGRWPSTFQLWLDSCAWNPEFDFVLFSDIPTDSYRLPVNVRQVNLSFEDVKKMCVSFAINECGADGEKARAALLRPYKLCDYKPLYGLLFSKYCSGYDYVGNCDIDLIWGKLSQFVPVVDQMRHRKLLVCGHLTLYRNDSDTLRLFHRCSELGLKSFRDVAEDPSACFFDEDRGMDPLFKALVPNEYFEEIVFDDLHWYIPELRTIHADSNTRKFYEIDAEHGVVACSVDGCRIRRQSRAYVHFQKRKVKNLVPASCDKGLWLFVSNTIRAGSHVGLLRALFYTRKRVLQRVVRRLKNAAKGI